MTLTADFSDEYRAEMARTYWPGRTLLDYFDEAVDARPERLAVIGHVDAVAGRHALTYAELAEQVDRIAAGLLDLGVRQGQVVSAQLPNWWQLMAVHLA
ncbi:MAG: AMP-binding protein, partial [Pseudonocardia sp.]|nr:AMP-binding protein [Pseudonocardia sp.]